VEFLSKLWQEEKARPPLILMALIVVLSLLWLLFGRGDGSKVEEKTETFRDVVVKGSVRSDDSRDSLDVSRPVTVHLSIPELTYQQDVTLVPDEEGNFEIPLQLPADKPQYSFDLDISQDGTRWRARSQQKVETDSPSLEIAELALVPPPAAQTDPRAHLKSKPATTNADKRKQIREERKKRRADQMEKRKQRRGRVKQK